MALLFDGTDDIVTHTDMGNNIDGKAALTVMCWIYPNALNIVQGIACKGTVATTEVFALYLATDNKLVARISNGTTGITATSTGVVTLNTWQHVALVFDGSQVTDALKLKLYLNAVNQTNAYSGTVPTVTQANADLFAVGKRDIAPDVFFSGEIGLLRVWNTALNAAAITSEYTSFWARDTVGLVLMAPYNDYPTAVDHSGNGYNGTLTGTSAGQAPPVVSSATVDAESFATSMQYNDVRADVMAHGNRHASGGLDPIGDIVSLRARIYRWYQMFGG